PCRIEEAVDIRAKHDRSLDRIAYLSHCSIHKPMVSTASAQARDSEAISTAATVVPSSDSSAERAVSDPCRLINTSPSLRSIGSLRAGVCFRAGVRSAHAADRQIAVESQGTSLAIALMAHTTSTSGPAWADPTGSRTR